MIKPKEEKQFEVDDLRGLETRKDVHSRDLRSFSRLKNFDRFVPGAIRRAFDFEELLPGFTTPAPIVSFRTYRANVVAAQITLGFTRDGEIYDVETGLMMVAMSTPLDRPFIAVLNGRYNSGSGIQVVNYVFFNDQAGMMWKWQPLFVAPIPLGVSRVLNEGPAVEALYSINDPEVGQQFIVGRQYRFAFYNPTTDLDSSPSDIDATFDSEKSFFKADDVPEAAPFVVQVQLKILLTDPNILPDIYNAGYTRIKMYATRDGGAEYFLMTRYVAFNIATGQWSEPDENGSISYEGLVPNTIAPFLGIYDGVFDLTAAGIETNFFGGAGLGIDPFTSATPPLNDPQPPNPDQILVEPAPLPGDNDPPELVDWGCVFNGRLWLVSKESPSKLIFSRIGEFSSFPPENFIVIPGDQYDAIISLEPQYQQLVIGKTFSTYRLVGTDFEDFVITPLDPQIGTVSRRGNVKAQGALYFESTQGFMRWATDVPDFYGENVRSITDEIPVLATAPTLTKLLAAFDSELGIGILYLGTSILAGEFNTVKFLLFDVSEESPFSVFEIPFEDFGQVHGMDEVELTTGEKVVLVGNSHPNLGPQVIKMFRKEPTSDFEAITQTIPDKPIVGRRVFRRLYVEGENLDIFQFEVSPDEGTTFRSLRPLKENNFIGLASDTVMIRFTNRAEGRGQIAAMRIEFVEIGESYGR